MRGLGVWLGVRRLAPPHLGASVWRLLAAMRRRRRWRRRMLLRYFRRAATRIQWGWVPRKHFERAGQVPSRFRTWSLRIHRGARWRRLRVQRFNVGFMWGGFARTQALAVFKKAANAKKRRKKAPPRLSFHQRRQQAAQEGVRRRASVQLTPRVEAFLRGVGL